MYVFVKLNVDATASNASFSKSSKVLKIMAGAFRQFCASSPMKSNIMSLGSVVRMKLGRSFRRTSCRPVIQSTGVFSVPSVR